jgi:ATP-dependent helicase/nuclease subunit A
MPLGEAEAEAAAHPFPDQATRLSALDPTLSFIVQAPAGSGKTGLLIQRFLKLLGHVRRPESVVALTFTRKAAAEMRSRVIAALGAAAGPEPEQDHHRRTWQLARGVLAQDQALDWNLQENPARLRIQTIDALCARLVRQMPWVSRMGALPRTGERVGYMYRRAARNMLAALDVDRASRHPRALALSRILSHLDNDVGGLERLLAAMLEKRDQWLRHVMRARDVRDARAEFERVLRDIVAGELEDLVRVFPGDAVADTVRAARFAASSVRGLDVASPLAACDGLDGMPTPDASGLAGWLGIRELFLTRAGTPRRSLDKRQGFPATPEGRAWKNRVLGIRLEDECLSRLDGVARLPSSSYSEPAWEALSALLELLPAAVAHLKLVFRAEARVDFTEVAQAARTALGSSEAPTSLAFRLDGRIQHLLVDEFQDTSQSQFGLLEALTSDWEDGDGRTLFLVGDPMQSIYGFRDADVALFLRARRKGLGRIRLRSLTLRTNFRSVPAIVDWVNRAIGPCFAGREDLLTGAVSYVDSVAYAADGDPAAVELHPAAGAVEEAARVVEIVRAGQDRDPAASLAVLVSARTHLDEIVPALRRAGVRFEARDIDALSTRPVVQDLLSLTRALLDPSDRLSWLAILRAPWCGLTLADLDALAGGDFESIVWDLLRDCLARPGESRVSGDGRERLARIHGVLSEALRVRGRMPLARWVEGAWVSLGGPAVLETPGDLDDARAWLDLLSAAAPGASIRDEARFREAIQGLFAQPDPARGAEADSAPGPVPVQLLTVHRAKGLEFDTVVLAGLGRATRTDSPDLLNWLEHVGPGGESRLLLAPIRESGIAEDALTRYLRSIETARRDQEATRLLYVGATRARRRLHIVGHARPEKEAVRPNPRSLLARIWPAVRDAFAEAKAASPRVQDHSAPRSEDALRRLSSDWEMPSPFPGVSVGSPRVPGAAEEVIRHPTFDWATDLQRRVGIVVHAMLQRTSAGGPTSSPWREETLRVALASGGIGGDRMAEAVHRVETALRNTLEDPRGRWILKERQDEAREYALTCLRDGRLCRYVLDRTFVEDGVRWIIDYKTGIHAGRDLEAFLDNEKDRYQGQLEDYARAMSGLDSRPIRLGLYFPLHRGWRSWAFAPEPARAGRPPI